MERSEFLQKVETKAREYAKQNSHEISDPEDFIYHTVQWNAQLFDEVNKEVEGTNRDGEATEKTCQEVS